MIECDERIVTVKTITGSGTCTSISMHIKYLIQELVAIYVILRLLNLIHANQASNYRLVESELKG